MYSGASKPATIATHGSKFSKQNVLWSLDPPPAKFLKHYCMEVTRKWLQDTVGFKKIVPVAIIFLAVYCCCIDGL